jgi:multiple sugar transport system permease protein
VKRTFFALAIGATCVLVAFPVLWLILTSLRPESGIYYVHRGTEFTLSNFAEVLNNERIVDAFVNSGVIATLATVLSLLVTVSSGYMLSRFRSPIASTWFGAIYLFRCVPFISWVLPLYFVTQSMGIYDTYVGLLLPHVAVHICFFSWLMKGFFDGIDPSMEYAALIDGCTRWGAFIRVALPSAIPAITALGVLSWLFTWNEFLFALILTGERTPVVTVVMAQFVSEMGLQWNLMSATAVLALVPAFVLTLFGQKYVIRGLRI